MSAFSTWVLVLRNAGPLDPVIAPFYESHPEGSTAIKFKLCFLVQQP